MEHVPDYMRLVVTGDDSGDDSGDEGSGRGREEEEDMEETGSPVGQWPEIALPLNNTFSLGGRESTFS